MIDTRHQIPVDIASSRLSVEIILTRTDPLLAALFGDALAGTAGVRTILTLACQVLDLLGTVSGTAVPPAGVLRVVRPRLSLPVHLALVGAVHCGGGGG